MTDDTDPKPEGWHALGEAWRASAPPPETAAVEVDVAAVRKRADAFARRIRRRNLRELVAGVIVVLAGIRIAFEHRSTLESVGGALLALGAVVLCAVLVKRGGHGAPPSPDEPTRRVLAYERAELEKQAVLLSRVWVWYLGPLVPGVVLLDVAGMLRDLDEGLGLARSLAYPAFTIVVFVFVGWLNRRAAGRLRARMDRIPVE